MFDKIKKILFQLFSDGTKISFMRISSMITLFTILGVWVEKNIVNHGLVDMGEHMFLVILTIIGGKVIQSYGEAAKDVKMKELCIDETSKP